MKPHNVGELKNADGTGEVGNMRCGDIMKLYIKVKDDKISNIKFRTTGCAAAIATSSALTDLAKGKTIKDALKLNNQDIVKALDALPMVKIHCSVLAIDALHEAVYDHFKKTGKMIDPAMEKKHQRIVKHNEEGRCHL